MALSIKKICSYLLANIYLQCGFRGGSVSLLQVQASKDCLCRFPTMFPIQ